ncbi:hypothetical protein GQ44DRAFT_752583 [Phaeosphaeriaceae sp. PMI808]|nr:hypothetical protein GQ44DRAFT_752583 [Phaeosphaeriaceae sp. PMI808]
MGLIAIEAGLPGGTKFCQPHVLKSRVYRVFASILRPSSRDRSWSIKEFLAIYDRNTKRLHGTAGGISLDAVWQLSFKSLDSVSSASLAVLSHVMPDSVPQAFLSEVLETLLALALIKRDNGTRTLSLHRLVQIQFKYFLTTQDRQKGFENAAHLLYRAFPSSNAYEGQLYARWTRCQVYIQHALSLRDNYAKESKSSEPLRPTLEFCVVEELYQTGYMLEIASYVELESMAKVLRSAFDDLPEPQKDKGLLADICASTGLMWAHRGLFVLSEPNLRDANDIRIGIQPLDQLELSWTNFNLGNPNGLLIQNIGRCYRLLGRYQEAHANLTESMQILLGSQNWAMLAYTQFALACLHHKERNLGQARSRSITTHRFNGACMFKLGCVAFELGEKEEAIKYLRESLVVAQLHKVVMRGDYARVLHKLSEVLAEESHAQIEALAFEEEAAQMLSRRKEQYQSALTVGAGEDYDNLVYILWR